MNIRVLVPRSISGLLLSITVAGLVIAAPRAANGQAARRAIQELAVPFNAGPEIGVTVRDMTGDDVASDKEVGKGAVVESVRGEGPAARAGLRAGDIVVVFDGEDVRSARQLARLIDETPADRAVPLTVLREGNRVDLTVTPVDRDPWRADWRPVPFGPNAPGRDLLMQQRRQPVAPGLFAAPAAGRLGIQIQDLTPQLGEYFGATSGVLVSAVSDETPAKTAGLQAGDVITQVNGELVRDGAELRQRVAAATGTMTLSIVRDRKELTLDVKLPEATGAAPAPTRRYSR